MPAGPAAASTMPSLNGYGGWGLHPLEKRRFRTFLHGRSVRSRRPCRTDLWCPHGFGHPVEDHDTLAATPRRKRLLGLADTTGDILPVVHHPDVPGRINRDVGLHLKAAA